MQIAENPHRLLQWDTGCVGYRGVPALQVIRLGGTIWGAAHNLALDGGAQHCAHHLHHHTWEQHASAALEHEGETHTLNQWMTKGGLTYGRQWQSPSPSGHCWWTWWGLSTAHGSTVDVHKHKVCWDKATKIRERNAAGSVNVKYQPSAWTGRGSKRSGTRWPSLAQTEARTRSGSKSTPQRE